MTVQKLIAIDFLTVFIQAINQDIMEVQGLGLAVVKTLVAILGGNIVAKVHANSLIITLEL